MDDKERFLSTYKEDYPEGLTDGYELLECIGEGNMGETLLAVERESGRRTAVKCYRRGHPFFADSEPQQIRELCFPGIPAYITEFKNDAMRCVVREYIEGENLEDMRGKLSERQICRIGIQLSGILDYLHSRTPPVIHRDIKPQNVIMQRDGQIALIDFGISRCYSDEETSDTVYSGTWQFAPPEQYGFAQTDCRSDIYSTGILLTWLYSGSAAPIKRPVSDFEKILAKSTAFMPKKRFCSAGSLKKRLERYLYTERRWKRVFAFGIASAAVLAAAVAVLGVLLWESRKENDRGNPGDRFADAQRTEGETSSDGNHGTAVEGESTGADGNRETAGEPDTEADGKFTGSVSGSCGDNAFYTLDFDTDTLTISGEGNTYHYYSEGLIDYYDDPDYRNERAPWYKYRDEFSKLVVEPGVTSLGNYSFIGYDRLTEVDLGGLECIGMSCFSNCNLTEVKLSEGVEYIMAWAFAYNANLESVELPKSVISCENAAFAGCISLKKVVFHGPTTIWTVKGNEQSILADDSGEDASGQAVFYCLSYGGPIIHAKEFGIPYIIIEE